MVIGLGLLLLPARALQGAKGASGAEKGAHKPQLQLLHNITGSFRPGVLTALMGVSGECEHEAKLPAAGRLYVAGTSRLFACLAVVGGSS